MYEKKCRDYNYVYGFVSIGPIVSKLRQVILLYNIEFIGKEDIIKGLDFLS